MNTSDLELFIRTADCGNITAAAGQLDTSPAAASAALKRLEKQLGVELFIRSTRQLRITAEGERFLLHCRQAIDSLEYAKASIAEMQGEIAGEIRMSVSSDLGRNLVLPWLDDVMDDNPQLSVQLSIGDSLADFYMDRVDVALRYGSRKILRWLPFSWLRWSVLCVLPLNTLNATVRHRRRKSYCSIIACCIGLVIKSIAIGSLLRSQLNRRKSWCRKSKSIVTVSAMTAI